VAHPQLEQPKRGFIAIFLGRLIPGLRVAMSLIGGTAKVPLLEFSAGVFAAGIIYWSFWTALGALFGPVVRRLIPARLHRVHRHRDTCRHRRLLHLPLRARTAPPRTGEQRRVKSGERNAGGMAVAYEKFDTLVADRTKQWTAELSDYCRIPCETAQLPELKRGAKWTA